MDAHMKLVSSLEGYIKFYGNDEVLNEAKDMHLPIANISDKSILRECDIVLAIKLLRMIK